MLVGAALAVPVVPGSPVAPVTADDHGFRGYHGSHGNTRGAARTGSERCYGWR
jgi:hypothetical protein